MHRAERSPLPVSNRDYCRMDANSSQRYHALIGLEDKNFWMLPYFHHVHPTSRANESALLRARFVLVRNKQTLTEYSYFEICEIIPL